MVVHQEASLHTGRQEGHPRLHYLTTNKKAPRAEVPIQELITHIKMATIPCIFHVHLHAAHVAYNPRLFD